MKKDHIKKDKVFVAKGKPAHDFEFNAEVAGVFDDMLERSVPFYLEQVNMLTDIASHFWIPGTKVYDLGCSTATLLIGMRQKLPASARLVGYDNSAPMLDQARKKIARKREALENVLVPYQLNENLDLFRRNGFEIVETFFQWFNFAGFLCVKKANHS